MRLLNSQLYETYHSIKKSRLEEGYLDVRIDKLRHTLDTP